MTLTSIMLAITRDGNSRNLIQNPTLKDIEQAESVHVVAFTSNGGLLVAESEGTFTIDEWEAIHEHGKRYCCDDDEVMQDGAQGDNGSTMRFVKTILKEKVERDLHWKE